MKAIDEILDDLVDIIVSMETNRKKDPWVVLHCTTLSEVEAAIRNHSFIQSHIIRGVKLMLKHRSTTELCLEIKCSSTYTSMWISVTIEEADASLKLILRRLEEAEEYEECAEIAHLIRECEKLKSELNETE
jgi:hypothetical protein